jgi:hypothetical protein
MYSIERNPRRARRLEIHALIVRYTLHIPLWIVAAWCLTHWR